MYTCTSTYIHTKHFFIKKFKKKILF